MRGRMSDAKSYSARVPIGGVMVGRTIGEVVREWWEGPADAPAEAPAEEDRR